MNDKGAEGRAGHAIAKRALPFEHEMRKIQWPTPGDGKERKMVGT